MRRRTDRRHEHGNRGRFSLAPLPLLITGQGMSGLGDQFFVVALPVIVLSRSDTGTLSLVLAVYGVSRLAGLLLGGPLADRMAPRRIMLMTDLVRAAAVGVLGLLIWTNGARAGELCVAAAVLGLAGGSFLPANFTIIPSLVEESRVQRAVGTNYAATQAVTLGGPVLAGLVITRFGTAPALAVDGISYLVSVTTLWLIGQPREQVTASPARRAGLWTVLRGNPLLKVIMALAAVGNIGFAGVFEVGLPSMLHQSEALFAATYGFVLAAFGLGAVLGSLAVGARPAPRNPVLLAVVLLLPQAAMLALAALVPATAVTILLFLGIGVAAAMGNVVMMTFVQTEVPADVRGRVSGALLVSSVGLFPVGALLAGLAASVAGPRAVLIIASALVAATSMAGLISRPVRLFSRGGEQHEVRNA